MFAILKMEHVARERKTMNIKTRRHKVIINHKIPYASRLNSEDRCLS
jgi:hypothetical protein